MTARGPVRLDQDLAAAAGRMLPDKVDEALRTRYRQLPVMVRAAGLAATYAFLVGKSDDSEVGRAYRKVADEIRLRLTASRGLDARVRTNEALLAELASMQPSDYARAAAEVQLLAGWLSRLGDARYRAGTL